MRIKTILLSALLGALSSVSMMGQVFSLNAVGYINVTCPPGFSIIANQLNTTNNNFSPLLDSQLVSGDLDGTTFFKFSGGAYTTLTVDSFSTVVPFIPWDQTFATNTTLNPGEATFVHNGFNHSITFTFVGTVLQGNLTNTTLTAGGFSMVSSMVPQAGAVDTALGMTEVDNDRIFIFDPSAQNYLTYTGDSFTTEPGGTDWDYPLGSPSNPTVTVGQGFFYQASAAGNPWVRNFMVN